MFSSVGADRAGLGALADERLDLVFGQVRLGLALDAEDAQHEVGRRGQHARRPVRRCATARIIGRATHDAIASGLLRPMRFGTSSPMISDSTVIAGDDEAERDALGVGRQLRHRRDRHRQLSRQSWRRRRRRPARRPG